MPSKLFNPLIGEQLLRIDLHFALKLIYRRGLHRVQLAPEKTSSLLGSIESCCTTLSLVGGCANRISSFRKKGKLKTHNLDSVPKSYREKQEEDVERLR